MCMHFWHLQYVRMFNCMGRELVPLNDGTPSFVMTKIGIYNIDRTELKEALCVPGGSYSTVQINHTLS